MRTENGFVVVIIFAFILFACSPARKKVNVQKELSEGKFSLLEKEIDSLRRSKSELWTDFELDSVQQLIYAIRRDFSLNGSEMREQLQASFPEASESDILAWEKTGKLEMRYIDGEKRYFSNAVANLRRLIAFDQKKKEKDLVFEVEPNSLTALRLEHSAQVIAACNENTNVVLPQNMNITYKLTVKPNVVPSGEVIRCWLPAPREGNARQSGFKILKTNPAEFSLASNDFLQRTFYMEKVAEQDKPTVFSVQFAIQTSAQYFDLRPESILPYNTTSDIYIKNTAERPPHIIFSPQITALAKRIVGEETNPLKKAEAIYKWINDSIPWASALEYGIIPNIPEYVLQNRHGDCGMHTLLFMTLARSQGIPAKWQSGFMLHPKHVNLHDWGEVYYEGIGWVPVDQSFKLQPSGDKQLREFYTHGIDAYRLIVNDDYGRKLSPEKKYPRSEPYDFQRGEVEWDGENLYFDKWNWDIDVTYSKENE